MKRMISIIAVLFLLPFNVFVVGAQQDLGYVIAQGQRIKLEHGMDLSGKFILHFEPASSNMILKNVNFDRSNFRYVKELHDIVFVNCSFRETWLVNLNCLPALGSGNDFTGARISSVGQIHLTREQLESTASFKDKLLHGMTFNGSDLSGTDFSGFYLSEIRFRALLDDCDFTDATIIGNCSIGITFEQLQFTKNYKDGILANLELILKSPKGPADFSRMNLTGCRFGSTEEYQLDLTDSVISNCDFRYFKGLTLENVKSTWNYKHNRMEGIKLPEEIQKALDAEKKQ